MTERKTIDEKLAREKDSNPLNGTAPYGDSKVSSTQADFDRNRDGLYGGLPDARDNSAEGGKANHPHPASDPSQKK